jgi:outer membrane lipoprotein-sorting protein
MSLLLVVLFAVGSVAPAGALTGREVIDTAQERHGFTRWRDRRTTATMETFDRDTLTRQREVDVVEQTESRGEHRTFLDFTAPADIKGSRFLHLSPRGAKDQQWLWTPSTRKVRRLGEAQRDENFFGTDLSYRDLELIVRIQQWTDAEAKATLEPSAEAVDGVASHVVELVPRNEEFPYSRYRLWFGRDDYLLRRVEVFDQEGALYKRVALRRFERVQDYSTPMEQDVASVPHGTRTVYKLRDVRYDTGVSEDLFTVSNLGGSGGS